MSPVRKVLVVDDDENASEALAALLTDDGFEVATAADGEAALAQVESFGPDVVLTDLRMPRLDGGRLARRLACRTGGPRVLAMSAYPSTRYERGGLPVLARLTKPIDYQHLLGLLRTGV